MKVAQCWDDGVATDVRVMEILRKYHAKATFNLCPGTMQEKRVNPYWPPLKYTGWTHKGFLGGQVGLNELVEVYGDFQVASHCWCHENAGLIPDADFVKAASDARKYLEDIFQRDCRGFAWPCGRHTPSTERLLREAGFLYGRVVGNAADVTACTDTMRLEASCHFQDGSFWQKYEAAKKTGVFYFWGHSYEMFEYDRLWQRYEDLIRTISADPEAEWVDVVDLVPLCRNTEIG